MIIHWTATKWLLVLSDYTRLRLTVAPVVPDEGGGADTGGPDEGGGTDAGVFGYVGGG